jgi:hypothetical protein
MRTFIRSIGAAVVLATVVLGAGASTALAAPVEKYVFDDAWCFDYGTVGYDCTVSHGTLFVTVTPDGRDVARIVFRQTVSSFDAAGVQVGTFKTWSFDRTVFAEGGQDQTFVVDHFRGVGEYSSCHGSYVLKIVDYELQVEHYNGPHCS